MNKLSIVVINENCELYLDRLFSSINSGKGLEQFDIIFVDNCSSDASIKKAEMWGVQTIKRMFQKAPVPALYNIGGSFARNEMILFIQSDIFFEPNFISRLEHQLVDKLDYASFDQYYVDGNHIGNESIIVHLLDDRLEYNYFLHYFYSHKPPVIECSEACFLVRKSIFTKIKINEQYQGIFFEHDFFYRLSKQGYKYKQIELSYSHYFLEAHERIDFMACDGKTFLALNKIDLENDLVLSLNEDQEIYIWGTGSRGRTVYKTLEALCVPIKGFIDGDARKHDQMLLGHPIYGLHKIKNDLSQISNLCILVSSMYYQDIKSSLIQENFIENVHFYDLSFDVELKNKSIISDINK